MNTVEVMHFVDPQYGTVRAVFDNDEIMFCGRDVAHALGYKDGTAAVRRYCPNRKKFHIKSLQGNPLDVYFITSADAGILARKGGGIYPLAVHAWLMSERIKYLRSRLQPQKVNITPESKPAPKLDYKILEEAKRMCGQYSNVKPFFNGLSANCGDCPASYRTKEGRKACWVCEFHLDDFNPAKAAEIIEKWSKEHPVKTYADVFFEKFPNARRKSDGVTPVVPLCYVEKMGCGRNGILGCKSCWQQPYPERGEGK